MKKLAALFAFLFISGWSTAEPLKTVFNPFTGKLDYITRIDSNTVQGSGSCTSTSNSNGTVTITCTGGGGGTSGTINNANQFSDAYYSFTGSSNVISGLSPGTSGYVLTSGGPTSAPFYSPVSSVVPAGPLKTVQYNSTGTFNGNANFTTDGSSVTVSTMVANNLIDVGPNISITSSTQQMAITNTQGTGFFFDPSSIKLTRTTGKNNCIGFYDVAGDNPLALCGNTTTLTLGSQNNTGGFNGGSIVVDNGASGTSTTTINTTKLYTTNLTVQNNAGNLYDLVVSTNLSGSISTLTPGLYVSSVGWTTMSGSATVTGSGGLGVTYGVNVGSMTGAGLGSCSGANNAVVYFSSSSTFGCSTVSSVGGSSTINAANQFSAPYYSLV